MDTGLRIVICLIFVFDGTNPLWVDIGSFVKIKKGSLSLPEKEFRSSILFPLKLWNRGAEFIANRLLSSPSGYVSSDEEYLYKLSTFKNIRTRKIFLKIHNKLLRIFNLKYNNKKRISKLKKQIYRLNNKKTTVWSDYHSEYFNEKNEIVNDDRFNKILEYLKIYEPETILELAGNAGVLSELIAKENISKKIICSDYDFSAIDELFIRQSKLRDMFITCARLDFMVPEYSTAELFPTKRLKSECVLALAVTHHLLLTQGYSYKEIFDAISTYTKKYIFIEFMPLGLWNGNDAPVLPKWYSENQFENEFIQKYELLVKDKLEKNRILFIGELKR